MVILGVCVEPSRATEERFGPQLDKKKNRKTRLSVTKAPAMNIQAASLLCGPNQTHLSVLSPEQAGMTAETEAARTPQTSRKVKYRRGRVEAGPASRQSQEM